MPEAGTRGAPAFRLEDMEGEPISPFRTPNRNSPGGQRPGPRGPCASPPLRPQPGFEECVL